MHIYRTPTHNNEIFIIVIFRLFEFYVVLSFSVTPAVNVHNLYSLNMIHTLQTIVFLGILFVVLLL
jgi:hypothetical protein